MQKLPSTQQLPPAIGSLELDEMIGQYQHLLVCLEADLKDRNRLGEMTAREFVKRSKRLKTVEQDIEKLKKISLFEQTSSTPDKDIGLPLLENCTPAEQETCDHSLMEKEIELLRIEQHTSKAHAWLRDAIEGKTGSILLTLRLSSLRRFIHLYSKLMTKAEGEREQLEASSEELIKVLSKGRSESRSKTTLQTLMNLFRDLENTISRVAKLRVTLKKEAEKVRDMNNWLKNEEAKFECGLDAGGTPTPMNLATSGMFKLDHVSVIDPKVMKKRRLIEQFWTEVIAQQKNVHIDQTDLSLYLQPSIPYEDVQEETKLEKKPESKLPHPSRKVRRKKSSRERHHD
jgi:hypothetical protein